MILAKVLYKHGTKATYLSLEERQSNALYFCTDTKELFKGNDLYSDGLRFVKDFASLPAHDKAADGILYFCEDSGCGYVLSANRDGWIRVIYGVDNETIEITSGGMMAVKAVPIAKVTGLTGKLQAIEHKSVELQTITDDLSQRLTAVEQAVVGGVHYMGSVETFDDLPADAKQGDLYEVLADNSEWCFNGEKWFEYGKTVDIDLSSVATHEEVNTVAKLVDYEISHKPVGTIVDYREDEIRILCPNDTEWQPQNVGATGNENMYYVGFKAYAPSQDIVSFKEDLGETINDQTMYYFEDNDFAGIDEYGRKYSLCWLSVATYDTETDTWSYFGEKSNTEKYIGWTYTVEWYNADGVKVAGDQIRINLTNEDCHASKEPYYVTEVRNTVAQIEGSLTWGDM